MVLYATTFVPSFDSCVHGQVSYDWRADEFPDKRFEDTLQLGLVAQDAEEVVPEIVRTDRDGWKSVQYSKLIPVMIEALKDQQEQIGALMARVRALEA